ncbi:MAG TPA: hypothetical protein VK636_11850 [Gemmatimonadaceae bacterium]|nr:hypothetical protein [Gemmatimonadaceae bacterium]
MNDDRMDELLADGTRDYNEPGAVPREEIWARVQAARASAPRTPIVAAEKHRPAWIWASAAVAAGIILYAGIAIGRRLEQPTAAQHLAKNPATTRRDSSNSSAPSRDTLGAKSPSLVPPTAVAAGAKTTPDDEIVRKLREQTRSTGQRAKELATATVAGRDAQSNNLAYRFVMLQHLAGSEAMITAFRSSARRGEVDREIAAWSRELLSTTRMLESSAASQDPTMRRLLEDLDLVIAQITQYVTRGTNSPDDLDLIDQSISKRSVIAKLHGINPGRNLPAGT